MTKNALLNLKCINDVRDIKLEYDWRENESKLKGEADEIISEVEKAIYATPARNQILAWLGQIDLKLGIIKEVLHKQGFNFVRFRYNHRWNEDLSQILPEENTTSEDSIRLQYVIRDKIYDHLGTTTEMMIAATKYVIKFQENAPKFRTIEITTDEHEL